MVHSSSIIILMPFLWFLLFSHMTRTCTSLLHTLAVNQSIQDGESLASAGGLVELGFFSPGNSTNRYLGVWYRNVTPLTVIWVVNRETPLQHNNSAVLKLNTKGVLQLLLNATAIIWSSNTTTSSKAAEYDNKNSSPIA